MEDFSENVPGETADGGIDRPPIFQGFQDWVLTQLDFLKLGIIQRPQLF